MLFKINPKNKIRKNYRLFDVIRSIADCSDIRTLSGHVSSTQFQSSNTDVLYSCILYTRWKSPTTRKEALNPLGHRGDGKVWNGSIRL